MTLSGGLNGGSEPPAFQRAERKRIMAQEAAADNSENLGSSMFPDQTVSNKILNVVSDTINTPRPIVLMSSFLIALFNFSLFASNCDSFCSSKSTLC